MVFLVSQTEFRKMKFFENSTIIVYIKSYHSFVCTEYTITNRCLFVWTINQTVSTNIGNWKDDKIAISLSCCDLLTILYDSGNLDKLP